MTNEIFTLKQPVRSTAIEKIFNTFEEAKEFLLNTIRKHEGVRHRWGIVMLLRNNTYLAHWRPNEPCFGGLRKYSSENALRPEGEFKATRSEVKPSDIPSVFPLGKPVYLITGINRNVGETENFCKVLELLSSPIGVRKNLFKNTKPRPIITEKGKVVGLEWESLDVPSTLLVEFLMAVRYIDPKEIKEVLSYTNDEFLLSIIAGSIAPPHYENPVYLHLPFYGSVSVELLSKGEPYTDSNETLFSMGGDYQRKFNEYIWCGGWDEQRMTKIERMGVISGKNYKDCLSKLEKLLIKKE